MLEICKSATFVTDVPAVAVLFDELESVIPPGTVTVAESLSEPITVVEGSVPVTGVGDTRAAGQSSASCR